MDLWASKVWLVWQVSVLDTIYCFYVIFQWISNTENFTYKLSIWFTFWWMSRSIGHRTRFYQGPRCSSKTLPAKTCSCRRAMLARLLQSNILSPYSYICLSNNSTCNITPARTHDQTLGFLLPLAAAGLKIQVSLCNMSADFQSAVKVIIFFRSLLRLCSAWWRRVGGWQ